MQQYSNLIKDLKLINNRLTSIRRYSLDLKVDVNGLTVGLEDWVTSWH